MKVPAYVRRAIRSWSAWRTRNRFYAAIPQLRELDRQIAEKGRHHRQGVRQAERQKVAAVAAELARELGAA